MHKWCWFRYWKQKNLISVSQETPLNEATHPAKAFPVTNRACLMLNQNQNIQIDKKEYLGLRTGIQKHRKQSTETRQGRSRARRQVNLRDMSCSRLDVFLHSIVTAGVNAGFIKQALVLAAAEETFTRNRSWEKGIVYWSQNPDLWDICKQGKS